MKAVDGFTTCEKQYSCNSYKIDLFFPELKLAFECDENHHNYNQKKDMIREEKISDNLTCKFIRFNPNDDNIGDVINIIFCKIFNKEIPEKIIKI